MNILYKHLILSFCFEQKKLEEVEAKSVVLENNLQHHLSFSIIDDSFDKSGRTHTSLLYAASTVGNDQEKNETKERLKAKFRQRRANRESLQETAAIDAAKRTKMSDSVQFFERSLQAVNNR